MRWYELDPDRFEVEMALLAQHHPGTKIIKENSRIRAEKWYRTRQSNYLIKAVFSDRHPYEPMEVSIEKPRIKGRPPHYFSNGLLCLHHFSEGRAQTTAKVYLDWTVQWIKCYEKWLNTREWPETNKGIRI